MEVKETEQQSELKELVRDIFNTALKFYEFIDKKSGQAKRKNANQSCKQLGAVQQRNV